MGIPKDKNKADFDSLIAQAEAAVEASGASNVTVQTNGVLDVEASGGSRVFYLGDPTLGNIETSGGSTVGRR